MCKEIIHLFDKEISKAKEKERRFMHYIKNTKAFLCIPMCPTPQVRVSYALQRGSAGPADYSGTDATLTFAPGDTLKVSVSRSAVQRMKSFGYV